MAKESSVLLKWTHYVAEGIPAKEGEDSATSRQEKVPGFNQEALSNATVLLIGAGGLGGEIGEGIVRKGVGKIIIYDQDYVELSNLNRQKFYRDDLYKNKALCLAKNLKKEAVKRTELVGVPFSFQEALEENIYFPCDVAVCGVDNNPTRGFVSRFFQKRSIPVVFTAVSEDVNSGYVFVQEPGKACFGCAFPEYVNDESHSCPGVPAVKDILKWAACYVLYGIDSVLMGRKRDWDLHQTFLAGFMPPIARKVQKRENCSICGK